MNQCFICKAKNINVPYNDYVYAVECKRCGGYSINKLELVTIDFSDTYTCSIISHWIRTHQHPSPIIITRELIKNILTGSKLPKPREQANNLLLWIGNTLKKPDEVFDSLMDDLISIIGAYDVSGVDYIIQYLKGEGLFFYFNQTNTGEGTYFTATLSFKGWDKYYELQRSNKDSRLAFMAMQFDNETLQKLFDEIIIDVVKQTGYEIRKVSDVKRAGSIDDKIKVEIRKSKFLIADLTDENRGAYWEAGFANGLGIEVIYICEREKFDTLSTHFDTNHQHTIKWDKDPSKWKDFAEELKATIRETLASEAKMED